MTLPPHFSSSIARERSRYPANPYFVAPIAAKLDATKPGEFAVKVL
jgi:hypothetical protein